jgi:type I restriction enzyme S subunit
MSVAAIELGQVCRLDRRVTAASEALSKGLEFVGMEHVDPESGRIVLRQGSRTGEGKGQAFLFDDRHVLFGKLRPYLRKIALPGQSGCASTELVPLLPDAARLDRGYLFHWVRRQHVIDALMAKNTGARMPRADMSVLLDMAIPLPPLGEQRRIVGLLDRAAEIRRRADAARAKARAIIPALFLDTFGDPVTNPKGWPVRPLGETATFFGGATLPAGLPFAGQGGGYLLCKVSTLSLAENRNGIVSSIEWSGQPLARSAVAPFGSILFPKRGAAISTNKKRILLRPGALDPNLMGVLGKPQFYIPGFLLSLFEAFDLMSIASGSTVPQLNKQDLYPLNKIVPPLQLQIDFAERADRLESLARHLDAAAAKAEAMAAGLSAEVFDAGQRKDTADGPSAQC